MREMVHTGYMHNHMRMYWAKKILEWSPSPEEAYATTLDLNNRYFLDGRDPSSYANVAWTFGLHDRPWPERPVFGKVRSMMASGLERKFDMAAYLAAVDRAGGGRDGRASRDPDRSPQPGGYQAGRRLARKLSSPSAASAEVRLTAA